MSYTPEEIVAALKNAKYYCGKKADMHTTDVLDWLAARVGEGREVYLTKDDSQPALLIDMSDGGKQT